VDSSATEVLGRAWLTSQLVRERIELARPERDIGTDLIAYAPDVAWMLPLQLKAIGLDGFTVFRAYVGRPLGLVYVLLADADGGQHGRAETGAYLLTPEDAWGLPGALGRKLAPDHVTYRFGTLNRALVQVLDSRRVQPGTWNARLRALAPLRRACPGREG
jgi:hypothetical protein